MIIKLQRNETSNEGTFGSLRVDGMSFVTGEAPWFNNEPFVSCIPAGEYRCELTWSPRFGKNLYMVRGVPRRSGIRFHVGNLVGYKAMGYRSDVHGCIVLGCMLGELKGQKAVLKSQYAMFLFEQKLQKKPFTLVIQDEFSSQDL